MEPTPSLWDGILRRASALRRRYANLAEAPQDTWSLVNRVAAGKLHGQAEPGGGAGRDQTFALWTRAMVSVLNDLHRRERSRGPREELDAELAAPPACDEETLAGLQEVLRDLARQDAEMGESKALLVALRYFEGLTWDELASALGSSVRRTRDEWVVTRAWLRRELRRRGVDLERGAE
jgi:DNA-directed RNA polymerase specialized sigma24 family protein